MLSSSQGVTRERAWRPVGILQAICILFVVTVVVVLLPSLAQEIVTDPIELAVEFGEQAEFTCSWSEENSTKENVLHWSRVSETESDNVNISLIPWSLTGSGRFQVSKGVLKIFNVTSSDSGNYQCGDDAGSEPSIVKLITYKMPSYESGGFILLAVCLVLLISFCASIIFAYRKKNLRYEKRMSKQRLYSYQSPLSIE